MAVPAHLRTRLACALPTFRVRIATEAAHAVAADAVRGRPLLVTAGAKQDVAARFSTVKALGPCVRANPARGMRIEAVQEVSAHAPRDVTSVAGRGLVTARTARSLRLRLDRVPNHEVSAMHEVSLDACGTPSLDREMLGNVVAVVALRLRVACLTQALFVRCKLTVPAHEATLVAQERLRQDAIEIAGLVARPTLAAIPLLLVLVAGEALAHRWHAGGSHLNDARMAGHALTLDLGHPQVLIVVERDFSVRAGRHRREHRLELGPIVPMAPFAKGHARQLVGAIRLGWRVATIAVQASLLPGRPAGDSREMGSMGKAWRSSRPARRGEARGHDG